MDREIINHYLTAAGPALVEEGRDPGPIARELADTALSVALLRHFVTHQLAIATSGTRH